VEKMSDITLEKVDLIRERTGVSYAEAKEALEICGGNVVDALVYIESAKKTVPHDMYTTKDEFMNWMKELVRKGNVTRIKIKKDERVLVDVPVNTGIAVTGLAALIWTPLLALGVLTAVITKVSIEITKDDGSVEIVNKIIKSTVEDVKEKFTDITEDVKEKINDLSGDVKEMMQNKEKSEVSENNVYKYTVKFEDVKNDENVE
jgi:hypothetical protein